MFAVVFAEATGSRRLSGKGKSAAACNYHKREMNASLVHYVQPVFGKCKSHLLVSSRVGGSASPRSSNSTSLWPQGGTFITDSRSHAVAVGNRFTHPKLSFWLRVTQVSGKQAMFPRIPTQISYRNLKKKSNLKPPNFTTQMIIFCSHTETHRETWTTWSRYHPDKDICCFKLLQKTSHILQTGDIKH